MARGWESKSVESQMEAAEERRQDAKRIPLTPEQIRIRAERELLEARLSRAIQDLQQARNPRYRDQLQAGIADLEQRLSTLNQK